MNTVIPSYQLIELLDENKILLAEVKVYRRTLELIVEEYEYRKNNCMGTGLWARASLK